MAAASSNVRTTWGEFLVLPENRSALKAVRSLCRKLHNGCRLTVHPLVLHGSTGVGKSHLVQVLLHKLSRDTEAVTARTVSVGDLARTAVEENGFGDRDLSRCDLLVLEDIQFLPAREVDALCALIDRRAAHARATIITANAGPARLRHFPQRLTARLSGGLIVQLQPLGGASRRTLLEVLTRNRKLRLTTEALGWLASQATGGGVRPLIGLLGAVAAAAKQYPPPIDRAAVQSILAASGQPAPEKADVPRIVKHVAASYAVSQRELLGPSRLRRVLHPRQVAMYLAREVSGLSLPQLGAAFGGRDHTTILHACRRVEAEAKSDPKLAGMLRQLRTELT